MSISKISWPCSPSDIDDANSLQKQPTLFRLLLPPHDLLECKPSTHVWINSQHWTPQPFIQLLDFRLPESTALQLVKIRFSSRSNAALRATRNESKNQPTLTVVAGASHGQRKTTSQVMCLSRFMERSLILSFIEVLDDSLLTLNSYWSRHYGMELTW